MLMTCTDMLARKLLIEAFSAKRYSLLSMIIGTAHRKRNHTEMAEPMQDATAAPPPRPLQTSCAAALPS